MLLALKPVEKLGRLKRRTCETNPNRASKEVAECAFTLSIHPSQGSIDEYVRLDL